MEKTIKFNPDLGNIAMSALPHREGPQLRRLPHPQDGDETAALDLRPAPCLACHLVAGLESPPGEGMRPQR